jgi:hypothetical protein
MLINDYGQQAKNTQSDRFGTDWVGFNPQGRVHWISEEFDKQLGGPLLPKPWNINSASINMIGSDLSFRYVVDVVGEPISIWLCRFRKTATFNV